VADFRRPGEALRDRHPRRRSFADNSQPGIGDIPHLRHHLAKLDGASFDRIVFTRLTPFPRRYRRRGEPDIRAVRWHRQPAIRKGPAERIHSDDRDVLDPIGIAPFLAQQIVNGLTVRPRFHQPRRDTREHAHVRTDPLHALLRVGIGKTTSHLAVEIAPPNQQVAVPDAVEPRVRRSQAAGARLSRRREPAHKRGKGGLIVERQIRHVIPDMQMRDDIVDRPLLELGFARPIVIVQQIEERESRVGFVAEIDCLLDHESRLRSADAGSIGHIHRYSEPPGWRSLRAVKLSTRCEQRVALDARTRNCWCAMKIDIDLKAGFLQELKREVLATLSPEERAIIEVSTGDMGNKPDAVKLGWLKMRTKTAWTKQQYTRALNEVMKKLRTELESQASKKD
jgi:hypothetical protein